MKVSEVCTRNTVFCRPWSNLSEAGGWMWQHDCGVLPVVDADGRVVGTLTDRDIAIALSTRNVPASSLKVEEVCCRQAACCKVEDSVQSALQIMRLERVRRLPVLGSDGDLHGILSLSDMLRVARPARRARSGDLLLEDVAQTLCDINFGQRSMTPVEPSSVSAPAFARSP